jgi:hypothetical protein
VGVRPDTISACGLIVPAERHPTSADGWAAEGRFGGVISMR